MRKEVVERRFVFKSVVFKSLVFLDLEKGIFKDIYEYRLLTVRWWVVFVRVESFWFFFERFFCVVN